MDEFLKMDIFFVVATLAVAALAVLVGFVLWRVQRILKNVDHISEQVAAESDEVRSDLAHLRADIRRGKGRLTSLTQFFTSFINRSKK